MAKEKTEDEVKAKKEKKEKKEKKRSEEDGVTKKTKKEKKHRPKDAADTLLEELEKKSVTNADIGTTFTTGGQEEDTVMAEIPRVEVPLEALVPFANPLADEKQTKKLLRAVQKGMRIASICHFRRGISCTDTASSCQAQDSPSRRQRSRQEYTKVSLRPSGILDCHRSHRCGHPGGRHLSNGCHLTPPGALRRS